MNPLEITLIIIGIIIIIISCIIVDKSQKLMESAARGTFSLEDSLTEEDKQKLKDNIEELLTRSSEEVIVKTDDTLSKISNEKIMAVNEFSDQILEKINRNHEEVIFLYNMLNDKEKELKSTVREFDASKNKVQDILEANTNNDSTQAIKDTKTQTKPKPVSQALGIENMAKPVENKLDTVLDATKIETDNTNNNTRILGLFSQGKSVMEISKLLDLGQGEVKLVIDLFKSKK